MPEYFVLLRVAYMCNALDAKIAELELLPQHACYCFEGDFCSNTLACVDLDLSAETKWRAPKGSGTK